MNTWNDTRDELMDIISSQYSKRLTNVDLTKQQADIVLQSYNIYCNTTKDCVDCQLKYCKEGLNMAECLDRKNLPEQCDITIVDGELERKLCPTNCSDCVNKYLPNPEDQKNPELRKDIVLGSCNAVCTCITEGVELNQILTVIRDTNVDLSPSEQEELVSDIRSEYNDSIADDPTKNPISSDDIRKIITDSELIENIEVNIRQMTNLAQIVTLEGSGLRVYALKLELSVEAVFNAIVSSNNAYNTVNSMTFNSTSAIRKFVNDKASSVFERMWLKHKDFVFNMLKLLVALMLVIVVLIIFSLFNK